MRQPQKSNRARGRGSRKGGGGGGGNNVNRVYESAGPEGKVRGTPQQIVEKYLSLARDAQTSGDRVMSENFLQHAEHYQRILLQASGAYEEKRESSHSDSDEDEDDDTYMPSGADSGSRREERQQPTERQPSAERQHSADRPARPNGHDGRDGGTDRPEPTPSEPATVSGLTTIDTSDEPGPDLLVATEEMAASQPKRPRRPRRRTGATGAEASQPEPESAPVTGGGGSAEGD